MIDAAETSGLERPTAVCRVNFCIFVALIALYLLLLLWLDQSAFLLGEDCASIVFSLIEENSRSFRLSRFFGPSQICQVNIIFHT